MYRAFCIVYYSDQQMHNILVYINNEFYIVSTTCFDAFASSSGRLPENDASAPKHHNLKGDSLKMMQMHRNVIILRETP